MKSFERLCYLDNSATTRPFDEVITEMAQCMADGYFNPSAAYAPGMAVEDEINRVRAEITAALGGKGSLVFTSGGTEADNLALFGAAARRRGRVVVSAIEHNAVAQAACKLRETHEVVTLPVDRGGYVLPDALSDAVNADTVLVSIMHVNNETGVVQDIAELAQAAHDKNPDVVFHSDGVQAFLRLPVDCAAAGIDLYTVSAHKVHGPKGIGGLYVAKGVKLLPHAHGGGQESGLRAGTENVPGILGFGKAVESYRRRQGEYNAAMQAMKLKLTDRLLQIKGSAVNGPLPRDGAPHILNIAFEGIKGEVLMRALSDEGIYVGMGSACSARLNKPSYTLSAMGVDSWRIKGAIRISLSPMNDNEDIDRVCEAIEAQTKRLRTFVRR